MKELGKEERKSGKKILIYGEISFGKIPFLSLHEDSFFCIFEGPNIFLKRTY